MTAPNAHNAAAPPEQTAGIARTPSDLRDNAPVAFDDGRVRVYHGDCLDVLASLPECSIDAVVTDPPYGLGFMGHQWDQPGEYGALRANGRPGVHRRGPNREEKLISQGSMEAGRYDLSASANQRFQAWCEAWARECLRVLKPGGHLLSFGGTRTYHRLAAGIEDAGFEIRDCLTWLYGSGFPKSLDVAKAIDKAAGIEGEWRREDHPGRAGARTSGGIINQAGDHSNEANPDGLRHIYEPASEAAQRWNGWGTALKPAFEPIVMARKPLPGTVAANVLAYGTGALNINGCRIATDEDTGRTRTTALGRMNDDGWLPKAQDTRRGEASRDRRYAADGSDFHRMPGPRGGAEHGRWPANVVLDEAAAAQLDAQTGILTSGGFREGLIQSARPDQYSKGAERERVRDARPPDSGGASRFLYVAKASKADRDHGNTHPTVKPIELMRWLVRLVTPPDGLVLDPFGGSGTTAVACIVESRRCVLIEREAEYVEIIRRRLAEPRQITLGVA